MPRRAVVAVSSCAIGLAMTYVIAVLTLPGQWLDDEVFGLAQRLGVGPLGEWLPFLARRVLPVLLAGAVIGAGAWSLWSARWHECFMALVIVVGSVAPAHLLRRVLPRPEYGYSYPFNTLPSTHVALVAALVVALAVLVVPRPVWFDRVLVGCVVLACIGNVVGHAHRPSDALASLFLVGAVAACVGLVAGPDRPGPPVRPGSGAPGH